MAPRIIILILALIATVFTTSSPQAGAVSETPISAVREAPDEPAPPKGRRP